MPKTASPPAVAPEEVEATPAVTIALDDSNREMFEECEVGSQKWVLLQIDTHDNASITATPLEVEYEEEAEEVVAGDTPKAIRKISKAGY